MHAFFKTIILIGICLSLFSQPATAQIVFPRVFDYNASSCTHYAQLIDRDTIICAGVTYADNDPAPVQQGALLSHFDSCGQLIKSFKYFDEAGRDIYLDFTNIVKAQDGGYCFGGTLDNGMAGLVMCVDHNGQMAFICEVPTPSGWNSVVVYSLLEAYGDLYAIGRISKLGDMDLFLWKMDNKGNTIFFKLYGDENNCESARSIVKKGDHILIGGSKSNVCNNIPWKAHPWFLEVNKNGEVQNEWEDLSSDKYSGALGLCPTGDKGWMYVGTYLDSFKTSGSYLRCAITKVDSNFNNVWRRILGNPTSPNNGFTHLEPLGDHTYLIGGRYTVGGQYVSAQPFQSGAWILKMTENGDTLWSNLIKVNWDPAHLSLTTLAGLGTLSNGTIVASGHVLTTFPKDRYSAWLTKLSPEGKSYTTGDTCKTTVSVLAADPGSLARPVEIFPNPFDDQLMARSHLLHESCTLALFYPTGQLLMEIDVSAGRQEVIHTADLPAGIYFWQVHAGGRVMDSGKIVKGHF